jgi:DNA (cytosine-5)-methyltransferase 1
MKFLDLFSGLGGFRLGLEMAGHECVGHCEIDKFANKSYIAMHEPKESEWFAEDITKVRADELPRADIWCFGFPCQDISIAGQQTGFKGHRSSLFFTVTGLIRDIEEENRPSVLFIENVKNLLSINRGGDFLKLLIELDEIGYDAEWQVLNSKHFGVPQNRERVFIIGHLRGRGTRKVFPIRQRDKVCNQSQKDEEEIHETALCLTAKGQSNWTGSFINVVGNLDRPQYERYYT